ncbi:MAG TPA: DUF58 domain-containing protein [Myxococcaceae bacterium]|nr:DUF58 domain-containing protein [Myxococcaceae bacterium]
MSTRRERLLRAWRRLWKPPRRLRATPAGRTYLVLTFGVGLGALNTGNNLLYLLLGLMLSIVVVSGILSERCVRRVEVRRLLPASPRARSPFHLGWSLRLSRGQAFALSVAEVHPVLGAAVGHLAWLPAGEDVVVRAVATAPRRGPVTLSAIRVSTTFPFGLFVKIRDVEVPGELLVLPGRVPAPREPPSPSSGIGLEQRSLRGLDGGGDLAQLRELREGEDARRIHWRKSAQLGTLLRVERDAQPQPRIVLHLDDRAPAEALDGRCEELAARAELLLARGAEVGLESTGGLSVKPGAGAFHSQAILRALARAGQAEEAG